jgi:hypothetical protein
MAIYMKGGWDCLDFNRKLLSGPSLPSPYLYGMEKVLV